MNQVRRASIMVQLLVAGALAGCSLPEPEAPRPPDVCDTRIQRALAEGVDIELTVLRSDDVQKLIGIRPYQIGGSRYDRAQMLRYRVRVAEGFPSGSELSFTWLRLHRDAYYEVARFEEDDAVELMLGPIGSGGLKAFGAAIALPACAIMQGNCQPLRDYLYEVRIEDARLLLKRRQEVSASPELSTARDELMKLAKPAPLPLVAGQHEGHVILFLTERPEGRLVDGVGMSVRTRLEGVPVCGHRDAHVLSASGKDLVAGVERHLDLGASVARP